tara:strand:- start:117 stop:413 length:297 start_codon:yes stop_codon:yes gene_type:complete
MTYPVSKGIPVPENSKSKYPFKDMEPGDSFFVPMSDGKTTEKNLRASLYNAGLLAIRSHWLPAGHGFKHSVKVRKTVNPSCGTSGFRVWVDKVAAYTS